MTNNCDCVGECTCERYEGHTAGPWELSGFGSTIVVNVESKFEVCRLEQGALYSSLAAQDAMYANARLIADAPKLLRQRDDLLEALRLIAAKDHSHENAAIWIDDIAIHAIAKIEDE